MTRRSVLQFGQRKAEARADNWPSDPQLDSPTSHNSSQRKGRTPMWVRTTCSQMLLCFLRHVQNATREHPQMRCNMQQTSTICTSLGALCGLGTETIEMR
jgi:hypothetical protein